MLQPTLGDPAEAQADQLQAWRDASKRVMRTYNAWCAASRRDRHHRYVAFLDALRREEKAAEQLERASSAPDGKHRTPPRKGHT
jgi:predicted TIM-barrel fold metal-dependent hydrolase